MAWNTKQQNRLTGVNPLAYVGVEPITPPQLVQESRQPTAADWQGFNIGAQWLVKGTDEMWLLVGLQGPNNVPAGPVNRAWWIQVGTGGAGINTFRVNAGHDVTPDNNGLVYVLGSTNIQTESIWGPQPNTITIRLNDSVTLAGDLTVASLSNGVVMGNALGFLTASNGMAGQVIIGGGTSPQWASIIAGANIILTPGPNTLQIAAVGGGGGGFGGLVADDTNLAAPDGLNRVNVLGDGSVTYTTSTIANTLTVGFIAAPGDDYFVGSNAGVTQWTQLTSTGGSVTITTAPGSINIEAAGVAALTELDGDAGPGATPLLGVITLHGVDVLTTDAGTTPNQVDIALTAALNGQIIIGATGGAPAWATLTAGAGISITNAANQIVITNTGGGGGGGLTSVPTDSGIGVVTAGGSLNLYFGDNTNTAALTSVAPNDTVVVNLNKWIIWPNSDSAATMGGISLGGARYMHNRGANLAGGGSVNTFLGSQAGNLALTTGTAINNVGIGAKVMSTITTTHDATAVGYSALVGDNGVAIGSNADAGMTDYNTAIGSSSRSRHGGVSVGYHAGGQQANTSTGNTFVGLSAGYGCINGDYCTALGASSQSSATANYNTTVGYQSGKRLVQSNNTLIGYNAGYQAAATGSNSGLGFMTLQALTSGSGCNTALGTNSLQTLQTGNHNIGIGYFGGGNLNSNESSDILIGNRGTAGQSNAIRIGNDSATFGIPATGEQDKCYIAGIYNRPVGATSTPVYIDNTSKLGSIPYYPAFLAAQTATVINAVGDGVTRYYLGTGAALSGIEYDAGGNFYPGDGAGAKCYFTAPFKGLYSMQVVIALNNIGGPVIIPLVPGVDPIYIDVRRASGLLERTYLDIIPQITEQPTGFQTVWFSTTVYMEVNWTCDFSAAILSPDGTNSLGIYGLPGLSTLYTWVCGHLITPMA